jgi:hypothetical protein
VFPELGNVKNFVFLLFKYKTTKMKKGCIFLICFWLVSISTKAQLLKRLQQKAEQKLEQGVDKKLGINQNQNGSQNGKPSGQNGNGSNTQSGSNPSNSNGGGLISTPPDVNQNLSDAETAFNKNGYSEARYSVQQAMLGVELEIGNQILKSLPETIASLPKNATADQVTSSGYGWAGLTIQREYKDNKDKLFRVMVANNAMWMSAVNGYLTSGGYAQQTGGEQNWKQTKVKGYRAIIEFYKSSGYKLSVPLGQTSLVVFEGVNFSTEQEIMKSAELVDIDGIKKMLGEQ